MYRLKYDPSVESVHDSLPPDASQHLSLTLAAACEDPWTNTEPYGVDDGIFRLAFATEHLWAVLFVDHSQKTVTVLAIESRGQGA